MITARRLLLPLVLALNFALAAVWAVRIGQTVAGATPAFDFPALYTGGVLAGERPGARLYDRAAQAEVQKGAGFAAYKGGSLPFVHPPHAALAFAPLGWMSIRAAFLTWTALQLALLGVLLWQVQRLFAHRSTAARWLASSVALAFPPVWITLWFGQLSLLMLVALMMLTLALRDDRVWPAAVGLLVVSLKPQLLIFPVLAVVVLGRWRILGRAAALLAGAVALSGAIVGPRSWPAFLGAARRLVGYSEEAGWPIHAMDNLRGLLVTVAGSRGSIVVVSSIALLVGALAFATLGRRLAARSGVVPVMAVAVWAGCFLGPHLFLHDDVLYLLAGALLCEWMAARDREWPGVGVMALAPLAFHLALPGDALALVRPTMIVVLVLGVLLGRELARPA